MTNLLNVCDGLIKLHGFQELLQHNSNFVENIKVCPLEMEMKTMAHVVLLLLILINLIKARGHREVKPRRDLTERVDAMEKSMGLLKAGFRSLAFLMADMMMGEKNKNGTIPMPANEEPESINDGDYEEAPYTTLNKLDHVGWSTYIYS